MKKSSSFKIGDILKSRHQEGRVFIVTGYKYAKTGMFSKTKFLKGISYNKRLGYISFSTVFDADRTEHLTKIGHFNIKRVIIDVLSAKSDEVFPEFKDNTIKVINGSIISALSNLGIEEEEDY